MAHADAATPLAGLCAALDEGLSRSAFLIGLIGVAGAGKTTSVQAWAAACDRQVRWISLKEVSPSRLPQTLLAHWADSIDGCPLLPQAIATLSAQEAMVQLRLMVRRLSPRSVWVMDDCDRSLQSADGQALLEALVEEADSDARLLLLSRLPGCLEPLADRHAGRIHLLEWDADWPLATQAAVLAAGRGNKAFEEVEVALKLCSVAGLVFEPLLEALCPATRLSQVAAAMPACDGFLRVRRHRPGIYELHPLFRQALYEGLVRDIGVANVNQIQLRAAEILRREGFEFEAVVLMATAGDEPCALMLTQQLFSRTSVIERFGFWLQQNRHLIGDDPPASSVWQSLWRRLDASGLPNRSSPVLFASFLQPAADAVPLESWCRHLRLIPCESGTPVRLDAELAWFHGQPALIEEAKMARNPDVATTLGALHVLRQPGTEQALLWQERSLLALLSQNPGMAHKGQLVLTALHLFLSRDRFRLDWVREWWRADDLSLHGTHRLGALLDAMGHLLAGDRAAAAQAARSLVPQDTRSSPVTHHEALVLAVCAWFGLDIPKALLADMRGQLSSSGTVMDADFDAARVHLLATTAAGWGMQAGRVADGSLVALQSGGRIEASALWLDMVLQLAIVQVHALGGEMQAALDQLATLRRMPQAPERLALFADAMDLIEAYCQSGLESSSEPRSENARRLERDLLRTAEGACLHPRLRERMIDCLQSRAATPPAASSAAFLLDTTPTPYVVEQAIVAMEGAPDTERVRVRTFGELSLMHHAPGSVEGRPLRLGKKLSRILLFILLRGMKKPVRIEEVCDEMWPDADGAAAKSNFDSAIHRLRQLLLSSKALTVESGTVSVNKGYCRVDLDFLDHLMDVNVFRMPRHAVELVAEKLIEVLRGPGIAGKLPIAGMAEIDDGIQDVVTTLVGQLAQRLVREGMNDLAVRLYQCHTLHIKIDPEILASWKRLLLACGRDDEANDLVHRFGVQDGTDATVFSAVAAMEPRGQAGPVLLEPRRVGGTHAAHP